MQIPSANTKLKIDKSINKKDKSDIYDYSKIIIKRGNNKFAGEYKKSPFIPLIFEFRFRDKNRRFFLKSDIDISGIILFPLVLNERNFQKFLNIILNTPIKLSPTLKINKKNNYTDSTSLAIFLNKETDRYNDYHCIKKTIASVVFENAFQEYRRDFRTYSDKIVIRQSIKKYTDMLNRNQHKIKKAIQDIINTIYFFRNIKEDFWDVVNILLNIDLSDKLPPKIANNMKTSVTATWDTSDNNTKNLTITYKLRVPIPDLRVYKRISNLVSNILKAYRQVGLEYGKNMIATKYDRYSNKRYLIFKRTYRYNNINNGKDFKEIAIKDAHKIRDEVQMILIMYSNVLINAHEQEI